MENDQEVCLGLTSALLRNQVNIVSRVLESTYTFSFSAFYVIFSRQGSHLLPCHNHIRQVP